MQAVAERRRLYSTPEQKALASIGNGARKRCTNPNDCGYSNYGGRGITFDFPDTLSFVRYVEEHLGPRPEGRTIDRIDNDKGYAPGNLRWATYREQRLNQRAYDYGRRHQRINLLHELRPDCSREWVRSKVAKGLSDRQILQTEKHKHYGTYSKKSL